MTTVTPELLRRYDVPGPRYTSYPSADRFVEAFGPNDYLLALEQRRSRPATRAQPLSLYIHIPFCADLCYYCACNKIITRHREQAATYLVYLQRELELHLESLGPGQPLSQLHLGGGTPTFLSDAELAQLMGWLRAQFAFAPAGEYAIEIDPRTVDRSRLVALRALGFNRLSFGVQDFDPAVQQAVHREQPAQQVFDLVAQARELGFQSVNVDLIYGLPKQSPASFARTLAQVAELRPDRIALYAYAHLPERFKPQRRIEVSDLPTPGDRLQMLASGLAVFEQAGYTYIGMDHFALPADGLAVAKRQGRLQRNFQGYSTQPDSDLIALGVSAIGKVGATYSQNAKTLEEYYDRLDLGLLPVVRGLALSRDDMLRRAVIMAIMCQGELLFEAINQAWLIDCRTYFSAELEHLADQQAQGLLVLHAEGFKLTAKGWLLVRGIALVFDRYLQADRSRQRFSRLI